MIKNPRPTCILTVQFKDGGQIRVQSPKTRETLKAMMKDDVIELETLEVTAVLDNQTKTIEYLIKSEIVYLNRKEAPFLFYSIAETFDPPKIDTRLAGIVDPSGRKL